MDVAESAAQPRDSEAGQSGGILGYLWYLLAAVAAGVGGFFVLRRRRMGQEEEEDDYVPPMGDAFADVELQDQALEVEDEAAEPEDIETEAERERENRGYGQRKHDQYASDVEANDALAEADIYIAYGRYPQAIDLLAEDVEHRHRRV